MTISQLKKMVRLFSEKISETGDPLFKRTRREFFYKSNVYDKTSWFDAECHEAKKNYRQHLSVFNSDRSYTNRMLCVTIKRYIKELLERRKGYIRYGCQKS